MMKVISLGLGVQSTAMYMMSSLNHIERADYAIFADPGAELPETYNVLKRLQSWQKENSGIPILITDERNILEDLLNKTNSTGQRWASIPAFSENVGMIRRQCTSEYKIRPIVKKIREIYGLKPKFRMPMTQVWLGISLDEIQRVKTSSLKRVEYYYPLVEKRLSRSDCIKFFNKNNFKVPPKSSCIFCPYHNDKNWKDLKYKDTHSWNTCVSVDKAIRNSSARGVEEKIYLHRSMKPLDEVQLVDQQELFMCEEGYCGL